MRILINRELTKQEKRQLKKELTELMNIFSMAEALSKANTGKKSSRAKSKRKIKSNRKT